jgi:hypothetical protein
VGGPGLVKQRVAARLLLASCTLALGLGLGTALAVTGILALQHPDLRVRAGGEAVGHLDRGTHQLFVLRNDPGGEPPVSQSQPLCTITDLRTAAVAPPAPTDAGFAAVQIAKGGRHRAACTSVLPVTVLVEHEGEPASAYLAAAGRGLLLAVVFTALAALLAARALVTAGRLRSAEHS